MGQQSVGWSLLRLLCGLAALWATALAPAAASAQSTSPYLPAPPPPVQRVDKNNVSLNSSVSYRLPLLSIGPSGPGGLNLEAIFNSTGPYGWTNNLVGQASLTGGGAPFPGVGVSVGNHTDAFALQSNGTYLSTMGTGASVSVASNGAGLGYTVTYTATDGSVNVFNTGIVNGNNNLVSITYKTGEVLSFNYTILTANQNPFGIPATRLASVTTNTGYGIHFDYDQTNVMALVKATAWNMTVESCGATAVSCSFVKTWPTASYSNGQQGFTSITDSAGVTTSFTYDGTLDAGVYYLTKIQKPSGWTENFHYTPSPSCTSQTSSCPTLTSVDYGASAGTWKYSAASISYSDGTGTYYLAGFDPYANVSTYSNGGSNHCLFPNVVQDALGRATTYTCDPNFSLRILQVTRPEGGYTVYSYDGYGNVTLITEYPKPSVGGSPVVTFQASYPCLSATICDKPAWTKDANGYLNNYRTDYTYDSATGLLVETQLPAVTVNGQSVRPTTANSYQKISTTNGAVWRLVSQATCAQSQGTVSAVSVTPANAPTAITPTFSCASGAADQVVTTTSYNSNGLPTGVTTSGNSLSALTTTTYDNYGDVQTVVGPLGAAFTTDTWYDAARRKLGVVGPAPGNGGSVLNRAQRFSYSHPDGLLTLTEQGVTSGYPDVNQVPAQWSGFTAKTQAATAYDAVDRKSQDTVKDGSGAVYAATQYIYDAANRLQCTAVRMNLAAIPASPTTCALGTAGSYGPDRITYNTYDAANEVVKITTGYATSLQRDQKTVTFTQDGLTRTVADGNGNLSTYVYDGFDRISQLQYPSPTTAGQSSTSDYEGFGYDANNNMTSHRLRDTYSITFAYDALNRKTKKTPSHEAANVVSYGYDALGRLLSETFDNNAALNLGFTYDALGRRLTQSGPLGTVTSTWDLGGRRAQLKWPDTNFVKYDYDNQNQVIDLEENGATSGAGLLASFTYDDLGDRTGVTRGDGVSTAYVYDPIGRLTSLTHSGASNAQAYTQIGFNPANEKVKFTTSNGAYAWTGASAPTQGYAVDGQNKYTSVGSAAYAYDANANLATLVSGGPVYSYDSENRLIGQTGGVTLGYYPDGSLWQTTGGSPVVTTYFQYDGDQIIGEYSYDGVNHVYNLQRRYVPGPGVDEPTVWYEGSTLANRRWLLGDHQGSVIAWVDTSGSIPNANIDTYDEYGQPGSGNSGRFQYTGQAWLPELSVYDYRARNYLPSIGRFMQTDPKGYDAGPLNLYVYADDDPITGSDPSGLDTIVQLRGYALGTYPLIGGTYGHSYDVVTDTKTGVSYVLRGGPVGGEIDRFHGFTNSPQDKPGGGGKITLGAEVDPAYASPDTRPLGYSDQHGGSEVIMSKNLGNTPIETVVHAFDSVASKTNAAQSPYQSQTNNSNNVAGEGYTAATGDPVHPTSKYPGLGSPVDVPGGQCTTLAECPPEPMIP